MLFKQITNSVLLPIVAVFFCGTLLSAQALVQAKDRELFPTQSTFTAFEDWEIEPYKQTPGYQVAYTADAFVANSLLTANSAPRYSNTEHSALRYLNPISPASSNDEIVIEATTDLTTSSYTPPTIGLFAINKAVTAASKASLEERYGFGESVYHTERLSNGDLKVSYTYKKPALPNPLSITYSYGIAALPSGDFALDMQAAMPPLSLYIDTNAIALSYTGDKIILPNFPTKNGLFTDAKGVFVLKKRATDETFLTYEVAVTNRKFIHKGNISLDGKMYDAYIHTYNFSQNTFLNNHQKLNSYQEKVEEIYLAGYGLVNQKRQGSTTFFNEGEKSIANQTLISELLNIR